MGRTVIIGGGAVGLSVAYHLAARGTKDVLLLERNQLTSGTSWHAAGIVGPLRATPNMTRLAMYALEMFPRLEAETGMSTGYRRTGGYWLARVPERMDELHRIAALGRHFGLDAQILPPGSVAVPGLNLDLSAHVGAMSVAEDANVNPVDLCMAYARSARRGGIEMREGVEVLDVLARGRHVTGVRLADGEVIEADSVALCAGAWSKPLADGLGVALPLQAVEHMYVVTAPIPGLPDPFPVLRDLDTGIYIKGDAGKLVIGGFEPHAKCWNAFGPEGSRPFLELPEDWDQFTPFMEAALALMPALENVGIQHFMNGPESFTHDTRPLVGQAPDVDGLYVAAGMNSVGIMSSAGIGRALADWMVDGVAPMDLWEVDVARADPAASGTAHMAARMDEAVADLFALHWPFKQPRAGRGLRCSVLHHKWAAQGAVFGLTAGWERGLWYASSRSERDLPYSIGPQPWWPIAAREAAVMADGTALLDLSPFGKFDVSGPDALSFLEMLCCAGMDRAIGRATYTMVLNETGGIEADVTVTRLAPTWFRITSGAATRWRDMALLRRRAKPWNVTVDDVTEDEAVIGVMGAGSRELLARLSDANWAGFEFSTCRDVRVAGQGCRATRMSFVGEMGWELSIPSEGAGVVFDSLIETGARPMGHYALEGCRIEKGFRHWGHDLGPEITPLEAGLGFVVDWNKAFTGKPALERQKAKGLTQRICLFDVAGGPLILHDELIYENGGVVGLTTSGGRGARTGLTLALGLIEVVAGETLAATCKRNFEIEVAGQRYAAKALMAPPFDAKGERMRA
ncbi:4-methylaminobutanoate oxidase (formaldehyde-forming) [Roseovarius litorisediminis]|uniref:4-methylaminobutanoate oxidase (Formaldehyde-forming) n=1 Tax=Roseovarius litorisediminis TaxID=1312363 RepID=A0A1Y5S2F3_9RHOB|nr:FAD-dependent oxidoreductase [Roseovarius litorisediminis]SLN28447.1 4-methylaminobutanoate oxidase (formaldehyde-forming) [Roseovarius litorisediminis]